MKGLKKNVAANIVQTLVGSVLVFALYKYINEKLGIELFGVWSLIMAVVMSSRVVEFGLGSAVTKYVAASNARNDDLEVAKIIDSSFIALLLVPALAGFVLWPLLSAVSIRVIGVEHEQIVRRLVPAAIVSFVLSSAGAVLLGSLDGLTKMVSRCAIVLLGQLALYLGAVLFIQDGSIYGLALAQILQGALVLIVARIALVRGRAAMSFLPTSFSISTLKMMLRYGANIQIQSIFQVFFDPATKVLLAMFSGPVSVGYFEIASRLIQYSRGLVANANRTIVPYVATFDAGKINGLYRRNLRAIVLIATPIFSGLVAFTPFFSSSLIGHSSDEFNAFMFILGAGWWVSTLSIPAYYFNMGADHVEKNTLSHFIASIVGASAGYLLGNWLGGRGVLIGYSTGLIASSVFLLVSFSPVRMRFPFSRQPIKNEV